MVYGNMCAWEIKNAVCLRSYTADSRQLADCFAVPIALRRRLTTVLLFNDNYSL